MAGIDHFYTEDLKVGDDIYALAFVALIDHDSLDKTVKDCMPTIRLNKREVENLYRGCLLVICF